MKITTTLTQRTTSTLPPSAALALATILSQPGSPGIKGSVWYAGIGAPGAGVGLAGDYYIATDTLCLYGPKTTVWGDSFACIAGTILAANILAALEGANTPGAGNVFITTSVLSTALSAKEPTRGSDDNYVSDDQLAAFPETASGSNQLVTSADLVSVKISPTSVTPTIGGTVTGTIAGVQMHNDGSTYRVNETAGGLTVDFEFTGVTTFNAVASRLQYSGGAGHVIQRKAWNWAGGTWDLIGEVVGTQTAQTWFSLPVTEASAFIGTGADAGKVRIRWEHQAPFNASHYIEFDHVTLIDSDAGAGLPPVLQDEAEAGTGTTLKLWSALRVRQAIAAWWLTIKTILGLYDTMVSVTPANGSTTNIDYNAGNAHYIDISALTNAHTITLTASNWPGAGKYGAITFVIKTGATLPTITWPAGWVTLVPAVSKTSEYVVRSIGTAAPRMALVEAY